MGELNKYAFEVDLSANKIDVSRAVKELYGVSTKRVNVIKMKGKKIRFGKTKGKKKDWKKAIITLKEGEIDFFSEI
jgi:large subunit ribosomal protein L23